MSTINKIINSVIDFYKRSNIKGTSEVHGCSIFENNGYFNDKIKSKYIREIKEKAEKNEKIMSTLTNQFIPISLTNESDIKFDIKRLLFIDSTGQSYFKSLKELCCIIFENLGPNAELFLSLTSFFRRCDINSTKMRDRIEKSEDEFNKSILAIKVTDDPRCIKSILMKNINKKNENEHLYIYNFIIKNNNGINISVPFSLISLKQLANRKKSYIEKQFNNFDNGEPNDLLYYLNAIFENSDNGLRFRKYFIFGLDFFIMNTSEVQEVPFDSEVSEVPEASVIQKVKEVQVIQETPASLKADNVQYILTPFIEETVLKSFLRQDNGIIYNINFTASPTISNKYEITGIIESLSNGNFVTIGKFEYISNNNLRIINENDECVGIVKLLIKKKSGKIVIYLPYNNEKYKEYFLKRENNTLWEEIYGQAVEVGEIINENDMDRLRIRDQRCSMKHLLKFLKRKRKGENTLPKAEIIKKLKGKTVLHNEGIGEFPDYENNKNFIDYEQNIDNFYNEGICIGTIEIHLNNDYENIGIFIYFHENIYILNNRNQSIGWININSNLLTIYLLNNKLYQSFNYKKNQDRYSLYEMENHQEIGFLIKNQNQFGSLLKRDQTGFDLILLNRNNSIYNLLHGIQKNDEHQKIRPQSDHQKLHIRQTTTVVGSFSTPAYSYSPEETLIQQSTFTSSSNPTMILSQQHNQNQQQITFISGSELMFYPAIEQQQEDVNMNLFFDFENY